MFWALILLLAPAPLNADILDDFNCSTFTTEWVYAPSAVVCNNVLSDASCQAMYEGDSGVYPAAGETTARDTKCYTLGSAGDPIDAGMKKVALENCPKTCGYCCQTSAYNCKNVACESGGKG